MTTANNLASLGSTGVSTGFKNRIINGAMTIAQRGTSFTTGGYTLDRWSFGFSTTGTFTVTQTTGAPAGFVNSLAVTKTTGVTPPSGHYNYLFQAIEGYNIADLSWGTANAKTVTLSFWVYSGATGTFGGSLSNGSLAYPFTYTVSSANTWTQISVTVPGPTTSTWGSTNNVGVYVFFDLGSSDTSARSAAGSWQSGNFVGATGTSTYPNSTSAGSMSWTGVQLEVGTSATGFEYRSYGTEFSLCERYYEILQVDSSMPFAMVVYTNGAIPVGLWRHRTKKRASPTVTFSGTGRLVFPSNIGGSSGALSSAYQNTDCVQLGTTTTIGTASAGWLDGFSAYSSAEL